MANKKWFVLRCPCDDLLARFLNMLEEAGFMTVSVMYRNPADYSPYYEIVCWAPYSIADGIGIPVVPSLDPSDNGIELELIEKAKNDQP